MITTIVRGTVALIVSILSAAPVLAAPDWSIPDGVKTVEVNGYPLAYIEAGTGTPIVIIHGAWVDHRLFKAQVAEFSKSYRAIAVSLRHYYPEIWDGKGGNFTFAQQASDVSALIRQLNLGKVHLLGHSRGGAVAIGVAQQTPELLRTLILEEPAGLEPLLADKSVAVARVEGAKRLAAYLRTSLDAGEERSAVAQKGWEAANGSGTWDRMPAGPRQMISDNIGTMAAATPYEALPIGCEDIRKFAFPVLFLQGESTAKIYGDMIAAARQCKPDITPAIVVPQARHNMHMDNPSFFNNAVLEFVKQN